MRKLNDAIDRFCARHPRFAIPGLMRYMIIANIAFYLLQMFAGSGTLNFLALEPAAVLRGELWRVVTYALFPTGSGIWLLISCVFYYWLGEALERIWGSAKFTIYYFSGVLFTALGTILVYLIDGIPLRICGADYVNSALFFAYALYHSNAMVRIYFIIPIKMKWVAWFEGAMYLINAIQYIANGLLGMAILPAVALMNLFIFFSPELYRRADYVKAKHRPDAVKFRRAAQAQQQQQQRQGYRHKCSVCGRTDAEYPHLQFRYCSKCAGYHCYCEDHIFNHVHYTE